MLLSLMVGGVSFAAGKKKEDHPKAEHKIFEVTGASITISLGTSGDQKETYGITKETKIRLNGAPADARDLRAGMEARVTPSGDKKTAKAIEAEDPKRHPKPGKVG